MATGIHDAEDQTMAIELDPLLKEAHERSDENCVGEGSSGKRPRIREISSVHKPRYGNWLWAER
jgi:hypothetical protein